MLASTMTRVSQTIQNSFLGEQGEARESILEEITSELNNKNKSWPDKEKRKFSSFQKDT